MRSIAVHLLTSRRRQRGRPDLDFATVDKIDRGIQHEPVAVFDAGAHLDGLIEVTRHGYGTNARNAALNDGDAETVSVEDDRLGRDDQRRSRDLQLNGAINPRRQRARIGLRRNNTIVAVQMARNCADQFSRT
jgi:hypothetical protein